MDNKETIVVKPKIVYKEVDYRDTEQYQQEKKNNRYWVTRQLQRIKECGHKFSAYEEPKTNCEWCWFTFFNSNGELVKTADECFREEGKDVLERIRGKKFTKMFIRFMATVAQFVKEQQKNEVREENTGNRGATEQTVQGGTQPDTITG